MKLALAQFDCRLGDLDSFLLKATHEVRIASERGADLICFPAPLLTGSSPISLVDSSDFEHDLLITLKRLSEALLSSDMVGLVPAACVVNDNPFLELFMLRNGRVIPLRLSRFHRGDGTHFDFWAPPVFDLFGVRILATFDLDNAFDHLPPGCDLVIYFQIDGFCRGDQSTIGAAAVSEGSFAPKVRDKGIWLSYMAPIGGFDMSSYVGGSFVLDDEGRMVAMAPTFDEGLIVQEIDRGMSSFTHSRLPTLTYDRDEWTWQALTIWLRDALEASGCSNVAVRLRGDLPSSALAALAVDALGARRVFGVILGYEDISDPRDAALQDDLIRELRDFACNLQIPTVERSTGMGAGVLDSDLAVSPSRALQHAIDDLAFADAAETLGALPLSDLTKTDFALTAWNRSRQDPGSLAPFGDIFLTDLEFIVRRRNRESAVIPSSWASLSAVSSQMSCIVARAIPLIGSDEERLRRARKMLELLEPHEIDEALEASIERDMSFADNPLSRSHPDELALLLFMVNRGEFSRRSMPIVPIVSPRSFVERRWPFMLGWSANSASLREDGVPAVDDLAREEAERANERGNGRVERMRKDFIGLLGNLLGVSPDQITLGRSNSSNEDGQDGDEDREGPEGSSDGDDRSGSDDTVDNEGGTGITGSSPFFSQN